MAASTATSGFGCLLKAGDGAGSAATQASVEWGSSNAKIRIKFSQAGTVGNGKNITVVVSGSSYVYTTLTSSAISITVPTTATVAQVIANLYQQAVFEQYWDADFGATPGDGSGTITARTVTPTAGGTDSTEAFTSIAEVQSISGPNMQSSVIDITHMESPNNTREFLPTLIDPGELSFAVNYLPAATTHINLKADLLARTKRNWRLTYTNSAGTTIGFAGYVVQLGPQAEIESQLKANISIKLTSFPTEV